MIEIFNLKKLFCDSLSGKLYYKIKAVPIIRLFFDFEYASSVWEKCYIKNLTERILIKIENIETLISLCQECDMKTKNGLLGGWAALETIVAEYRFY